MRPRLSLVCAECGKPLLSIPGGHLSPDLELWQGNFCPACGGVYCKECLDDWVGFQPPCPRCGEKTYPASRHLLRQAGLMQEEPGKP